MPTKYLLVITFLFKNYVCLHEERLTMSVSSGRNPKGYYQRSLNSKDHTFRKYGRSLLNPKCRPQYFCK